MGADLPPPRIQDNKLGLTTSLFAGRAAKCLLPPRPPLKGWAVKVLGCPQAAGHPAKEQRPDISIMFSADHPHNWIARNASHDCQEL